MTDDAIINAHVWRARFIALYEDRRRGELHQAREWYAEAKAEQDKLRAAFLQLTAIHPQGTSS